jgi:hypothetical protein
LCTLEDPRHPGFFHNTHAFFLRAITAMPWYADLVRHGAQFIEPDLNVALVTTDGRVLEWWTDIRKTHPEGNITGLPGYNAAQVILADLGIKADWMPPPILEQFARLSTK